MTFAWFDEKLDSNRLPICELAKEIVYIAKNSFDHGDADLTPSDVEHILKITSDVTHRIKSEIGGLTA